MPTKLYLRRAGMDVQGSLPMAASTGAQTPTWTPGSTNTVANTPYLPSRAMDAAISTVNQTSLAYSTDNVTTAQRQPLLRFVSAPLSAQTIPVQSHTVSMGWGSSNSVSAFSWAWTLVVWRPSTGAVVGTLYNFGTSSAVATTQTHVALTANTLASVTCQAGDVLALEIWRNNAVQTMATSYTNTLYYDGTTEGSATNVAAYLSLATTTLAFETPVAQIVLRGTTTANSLSSNFTFTLPPGTTDGDFLLVWLYATGATGVQSPPAGWSRSSVYRTGTGPYGALYWAPYSAGLTLTFQNSSISGGVLAVYYKSGQVISFDGDPVVQYDVPNDNTITYGQPVTTVAGDYEVITYAAGIGPLGSYGDGLHLDSEFTVGAPSWNGGIGHNQIHPLGSGVTCPAFQLITGTNVSQDKVGVAVLLKAVTPRLTPTLVGPVDAFANSVID